MHSILLIVDKPNIEEAEANQAWLAFQVAISNNLGNNGEAQQGQDQILSENVLLFDANTSFDIFVTLTSLAQSSGFPYQVLFFEKGPQWIQHSP
jgi:hypothetical protein